MDITNKTKKPLSIPLPGGKKLFLGPGQTGQVTQKALAHPGLAKLLEAGDIESAENSPQGKETESVKTGMPPGTRHEGSGAKRQSGDR